MEPADSPTLPACVAILQQELRERLLENTEGKKFLPERWLADLLTEARILVTLQALDAGGVGRGHDEYRKVAGAVRDGGQKVFAILLWLNQPRLVYRFLETNQFDQKTNMLLDKRLPMEGPSLEHALGIPPAKDRVSDASPIALAQTGLYNRFLSTQAMFLVPSFPYEGYHRILQDSTTLPLLPVSGQEGQVAQGAFGQVTWESLPAVEFRGDAQRVVRKELKSRGAKAHQNELRCLRLLGNLNHPNLLRLYGSYTHRGKHNFLFEEARQGDLHGRLESDHQPDETIHHAFFVAFCGLASALQQLHCYTNEDFDMEMIGCHHDLKPRNILVDDWRFIIADFGLATMKNKDEDPYVLAEDRDVYFAAPENIDYVAETRGKVGPPGDIWSLGCILTEILTFMHRGGDGVRSFRESRGFPLSLHGGLTIIPMKAFHNGAGGVNPEVLHHLEGMRAAADKRAMAAQGGRQPHVASFIHGQTAEQDLIDLIREMLTIDPSRRPVIQTVLQRLRCIALQKLAEPVCKGLLNSPHDDHLVFFAERQLFLEWLSFMREKGCNDQLQLPSDAAFDAARQTLRDLEVELKRLAEDEASQFPVFRRLQTLNQQLLTMFDALDRTTIQRAVDHKTSGRLRFGNAPTSLALDETELEPHASGAAAKSIMLRAVERAQERIQRTGCREFMLEESNISFTQRKHPCLADQAAVFQLGVLKRDTDPVGAPIIVEKVRIDINHVDAHRVERFFARLENILNLGNAALPATDLFALNCRGIYLDSKKQCLGLVYDFPSNSAGGDGRPPARPVSFAELMLEHRQQLGSPKHNRIITLDDRLRLARDLALAVSTFHSIHWLHKNISSHTVLFFLPAAEEEPQPNPSAANRDTTTAARWPQTTTPAAPRPLPRRLPLPPPALIGFSHSRPAAGATDSHSSKVYYAGDELCAYQHPSYARDAFSAPEVYRPAFDYYSLGLVLLELGLWMPLRMLAVDGNLGDRVALRKWILDAHVPCLEATVGEAYAGAVRACLSGELEEGGADVEERFRRLVMAPLEARVAGRR